MAFLLQLQLLIWKNLTLRKRHWGRLLIEIIWPLFLFVILFLVRLRGLKKFHHECECHFWNVSGLIWKLEISHLRQFWGEGDALCWDSTFCPNIYLHLQQHLPQVSWWWRWINKQNIEDDCTSVSGRADPVWVRLSALCRFSAQLMNQRFHLLIIYCLCWKYNHVCSLKPFQERKLWS